MGLYATHEKMRIAGSLYRRVAGVCVCVTYTTRNSNNDDKGHAKKWDSSDNYMVKLALKSVVERRILLLNLCSNSYTLSLIRDQKYTHVASYIC